ncbi:hypothetical protein V8G61_11370 [Gaetbulibacter sp. M240]|uniref:hypothetical protein n=1 Tax=Gaetbulibacter sp. M240 TaxID=3126511 RepID=UPI00374ECD1C
MEYFLLALVSSNALVIYLFVVKQKAFFFTLFIALFAIADCSEFLYDFFPSEISYYLFGNSLFILAYNALLIEVCKDMSLAVVIKKFKYHILVLFLLTIYGVASLDEVIGEDEGLFFYFELLYNTSALVLLFASLIAYFYHENKKSFFLFIGILFLIIQEIVAIGFLFVSETIWLNVIWILVTTVAFYFLISQARISYRPKDFIF